jgi:hypothetical protein
MQLYHRVAFQPLLSSGEGKKTNLSGLYPGNSVKLYTQKLKARNLSL